jgi:hypothetical protein
MVWARHGSPFIKCEDQRSGSLFWPRSAAAADGINLLDKAFVARRKLWANVNCTTIYMTAYV